MEIGPQREGYDKEEGWGRQDQFLNLKKLLQGQDNLPDDLHTAYKVAMLYLQN